MSNIALEWSQHLSDPKKRKEFEETVKGGTAVLRRFRDMIRRRINELNEPRKVDYDSPSWAYLQADQNGRKAILIELHQLLEFFE